MKRIPNRMLIGMPALILAPFVAMTLVAGRQTNGREAGQFGRYSPDEVMRMSADVCRRVAGDTDVRTFRAKFDPAVGASRDAHSEWTVLCSHDTSPERIGDHADVVCRWDAITGKLCYVERSVVPDTSARSAIGSAEAVRRAKKCLTDLNIAPRGTSMRVVQPPSRNTLAWVVRVKTDSNFAIIRITLNDGALQSIRVV